MPLVAGSVFFFPTFLFFFSPEIWGGRKEGGEKKKKSLEGCDERGGFGRPLHDGLSETGAPPMKEAWTDLPTMSRRHLERGAHFV